MNLIINKPYIKNNKLIAKIEYENKTYDMYFEVEKEYIKYLCNENANAFLIALLPFIVKHNYNVIIKSKISSKLYYQLTTYLLPLLCKEFKKENISINCELTDKKYNSSAVGASISCGVDSFYTLLKHQKCKDSKYNITHLCFFNAGSNGEYGGEKAERLFKERVKQIKKFCEEYNYPLIAINSNMNELIMMNHEKRHTFTTLSCVYVLEKLFNIYYFASGLNFNGSHIDESDTAFYDILNIQCLSNENITFYCSGLETTRMKKVEYISNYQETYNYLNVCVGNAWKNCCYCNKCIRTMTELESINKLELYKNVFDLKRFYKKRAKIYSIILEENKDIVNHEFYQEIIDECKKNKVKIPLLSYIYFCLPSKKKIKKFLKKILPKKIILKIKQKRNNIHDGWMD